MNKKFTVLQVASTENYLVRMHDRTALTDINNWSLAEVIDDWFMGPYNLNRSHAARDAHRIGGSIALLDVCKIGTIKMDPCALVVPDVNGKGNGDACISLAYAACAQLSVPELTRLLKALPRMIEEKKKAV